MDSKTWELLSRMADDDLPAAEAVRLRARLEREPELASELAALKALRSAVRARAATEEPPLELDRLLEPLRQAAPVPARARPALRWLGIAACLAMGVSVTLKVVRQTPGPPPEAFVHRRVDFAAGSDAARPASEEPGGSEYFQLQPLPGPEEGTETVGVIEDLLTRPEPEPRLADPRPLDVMGPLPEPVGGGPFLSPGLLPEDVGLGAASGPGVPSEIAVSEAGPSEEPEAEADAGAEHQALVEGAVVARKAAPAATLSRQALRGRATSRAEMQAQATRELQPAAQRCMVTVADAVIGGELACMAGLRPGAAVSVSIAGGVVTGIRLESRGAADEGALAALVGCNAEGLDDGVHQGLVQDAQGRR